MMARPRAPDFDPEALEAVCRRLGLRRVVMFGSRATGSPPPHDDSDLDIAVWHERADGPEWWRLQSELAEVFPGEQLDVVDLAEADPLFRWEIMRDGVLLYGDELDLLELRAFAYRDFVDSSDLRELERTLSLRKLEYVKRLLDGSPAA